MIAGSESEYSLDKEGDSDVQLIEAPPSPKVTVKNATKRKRAGAKKVKTKALKKKKKKGGNGCVGSCTF